WLATVAAIGGQPVFQLFDSCRQCGNLHAQRLKQGDDRLWALVVDSSYLFMGQHGGTLPKFAGLVRLRVHKQGGWVVTDKEESMCLAMPGKVMEIVDVAQRIGRVDIVGTPRLVHLGMLDEVTPGDWVLVQLGLAVEKIDGEAAQEAVRLWEELRAAVEQALASTMREEVER